MDPRTVGFTAGLRLVPQPLVQARSPARPAVDGALEPRERPSPADDARVGAAVFASDDAKEGPRAFAEKRKPEFRGR